MAYRDLLFLTLAAPPIVLATAACSADGAAELVTAQDASATEPPPAVLPPPSTTGDDAGVADAAVPKDAGAHAAKDAASDAAVDAGPPAPNPGEPCAVPDTIYTRTCGACGTQQAICLSVDGGPATVTDYSPCENELAGGCVPGTIEQAACGNCGTRTRTCTQYCAWQNGACQGEPPSSCQPTTEDYTTAGCPSGGVRRRSCGSACTWTNFTLACEPLAFRLVAAATAGETVSAIYPLRASVKAKRLTGTCGATTTLSSSSEHPYVAVEIVNPTESTLTLSAWNTQAPNGGPVIDTVMAAYAGAERPVTDDARKACSKGVNDTCPSGVPCGDGKWAGLTGANAIDLPPLGSVIVWFGAYYAVGGSSTVEGDVRLVVRTDSVQAP